jgi:hypothetical protein
MDADLGLTGLPGVVNFVNGSRPADAELQPGLGLTHLTQLAAEAVPVHQLARYCPGVMAIFGTDGDAALGHRRLQVEPPAVRHLHSAHPIDEEKHGREEP